MSSLNVSLRFSARSIIINCMEGGNPVPYVGVTFSVREYPVSSGWWSEPSVWERDFSVTAWH